ncbi:MAG TPA: hypothetical protein VF434_12230 [Promineifilum sp.]
MNHNHDHEPEVLAETDMFAVWRSLEDDDAFVYHVELGGVTMHLSAEEWEELVSLIRHASA